MAFDPFPGPALTALEQWFDSLVRHQIGLLRVAGGIRNQTHEILDATERDLRRAIRVGLADVRGFSRPSDLRRVARLIERVKRIRGAAWKDVAKLWREQMTGVALAEPTTMSNLLTTVMPVDIATRSPSIPQLRSIVKSSPFEGRTLRQWAQNIARADVDRIAGQIRIGLVQNETLPVISRRIVGTAQLNGANGVTAISRRQAAGIVRTAVNHTANQARQAFSRANDDVVRFELYIATIDGRTTLECLSLDGRKFKVGDGPIPPIHFLCRSMRNPIPDEKVIGERPFNPTTEKGLLREYAQQRGIPVPKTRAGLPRGSKKAFDEFARRRKRELIGRVPAKTTYAEFLKRQPAAFQNDVLGVTRAKLFRSGKISVDKFVDITGKTIPLSQLARFHADAFRAAGLNPAAFR